ncbi:FixH family protein [Pseudoduganella buxea]|uniref:Cytochrome oxidase assembly protein n=1 Tax=Pseudoduganella buxea TaxID=1949069 RepID=A0A6I3SXQ3_9BURK|nr:FixH family protein [Pseudoduganella buxea]MTV52457.1 cytochrome oxidase assembly protein [Pseudoduganella buxea]GGC18322.1 membrane protein [Pseudoduganella buxea]
MDYPLDLPSPWYAQRWPWLLMLGPAIVLVACFYTGWIAFSQQDALVVGDYYKKGKAINQDLRRDRAAGALGVTVALRYDAAEGQLRGRIATAGGKAVTGPLPLHLAHATQPDKDIRLLLHPAADGSFAIPLPLLERSRWVVLVEDAHKTWRLEGQWLWPAEHAITLSPQQQ